MPEAYSLDYDALARAYVDNLQTALRNFSQGPAAFLEGWAHDDDAARSVLGMFEAACDAGVPALTVQVGRETLTALNRPWLDDALRELGLLDIRPNENGMAFHVEFTAR